MSINLKLPEPLLLSPSTIKFKSPVSLLITSKVFASFPNLKIPVLLPALAELPILTLVVPLSDTTSTEALFAYLTVKSEPGIALPTPTLPVLNAENTVALVPTCIDSVAVITPVTFTPLLVVATLTVGVPTFE